MKRLFLAAVAAFAVVATTTSVLVAAKPCYELSFNGLGDTACGTNASCDQYGNACLLSCMAPSASGNNYGPVRPGMTCQSLPWCQTLAYKTDVQAPVCRTRCSVMKSPDTCWPTAGCLWVDNQCVGDCAQLNTPIPPGPINQKMAYDIWDKKGCEATKHCVWSNKTTGSWDRQRCEANCGMASEPAGCIQLGAPCAWDPWAGCATICSRVSDQQQCLRTGGGQCQWIWQAWSGGGGKGTPDDSSIGYCLRNCESITSRGQCEGEPVKNSGYGSGMDDCMWTMDGKCTYRCDRIKLVQRNSDSTSFQPTSSRWNAGFCTSNPACDVDPNGGSNPRCVFRFCEKLSVEQCLAYATAYCTVVGGKCTRTCGSMDKWSDLECVNNFAPDASKPDDKNAWLCWQQQGSARCYPTDCGNYTVMGATYCNAQSGCQWTNSETCVQQCNWISDNATCQASPLGCAFKQFQGCVPAETDCEKIRIDNEGACLGWNKPGGMIRQCVWYATAKKCNRACSTWNNETDCVASGCLFYNRTRWGSECRLTACPSYGGDYIKCLKDSGCVWDQYACSCNWRCEYMGDTKDACETNGGSSACKWNDDFKICGYPVGYDFSSYCGKPGLSAGAIAGVVIGTLIGVAIIVGAILYFCKCIGGGSSSAGGNNTQFGMGGGGSKAAETDGFMSYQPAATNEQLVPPQVMTPQS